VPGADPAGAHFRGLIYDKRIYETFKVTFRQMNMMYDFTGMGPSVISSEKLLGRPLNDIEAKYAPKELYVKGPMEIPLACPRVSVIGTRNPSMEGVANAQTMAKALVENQALVVSGLASGIDTAAHQTAIDVGGKTIAVLGTPLNKAYPKKNFCLQKEIMEKHLAVSQFPSGYPITRKNFVIRNRTMALISDATIIAEAGDTSGSLHQGWETIRLGRPLFILEPVVDDTKLSWPQQMIQYGAMKLSDPDDIFEFLPSKLVVSDLFS